MPAPPVLEKNMDRLFFDTNVLLDVLEQRTPWFPESSACLLNVRRKKCIGAMTVLSLSDIAYIQKSCSAEELCVIFKRLRVFLDVAPLNAETVDGTLAQPIIDLEDSFQYQAALKWGATHLITRNVKDFPQSGKLTILSPTDYLQTNNL